MINSTNNDKVKYFRKLRNKKYIEEYKKYIVEGYHLVLEAIKANVVDEIILLEGEEFNTDKKVTYVSHNVLKSISKLESVPNIMAVCTTFPDKSVSGNKILLLDNVSDPGNIGTIIRSAVAFNIDTVVFSKDSVNIYNDKLIRATQGMFFYINIVKNDLNIIIDELKNKGIKVIGTSLKSNKYLSDIKKLEKYALIVGNEGNGVKKDLLNKSDILIKIKMNDKCESLNVAVASAIVMHYMEE